MDKDTTKSLKNLTEDNVKFNLRKNPKNKKTNSAKKGVPIYARFRYFSPKHNKFFRLHYPTKKTCKPSKWDTGAQRPMSLADNSKLIKKELDKIQSEIINIYADNRNIDIGEFKRRLDISLGRVTKAKGSNDVTNFIEFIDDFSARKAKLEDLSPNTLKKYKSVKNKLVKFNEDTGDGIDYQDFDLSFKDHYLGWLYNNTTSQSANTANKDFATIKVLLKKAFKEKLHTNLIFNDEDFGVSRVKTSKIAWSEEEVQLLFDYKVGPHKRLKEKNISVPFAKKVKDWYLVACYSSLRWSDFTNIGPDNMTTIQDGLFIHTWTQKNNEEVYIPINENLLSILEEYNYQSPQMSSQRFNEAIKVVAEIAGIKAKVILSKSVKGKPVTVAKRKCDIVSSHDGRRTWASINYAKGFPILLLMQVTGHRKESTFLSYIGVSKKEMAIKLMEQMKAQESKLNVA
ncbi:site-specific integrase [Saprospiraceae bacterium]|nr:site-specific integrase [Saprospiraceae bacterium]